MKIWMPSLALAFALTAVTSVSANAQSADGVDNVFTPPSNAAMPGGQFGGNGAQFGGNGGQFGDRQLGGGRRQFRGANGRGRQGAGKNRIPNLKQIRALPSLTPQQRKQIVQIMRQSKADTQPLMEQAREIGLQIRNANPGSSNSPGSTGFQPASVNGGGSNSIADNADSSFAPSSGFANVGKNGKNKLGSMKELRASGAMRNADPQTKAKLRQIRQQIQAKRQDTWNQVKQILTAEQVQELENMRSGQLMPASLQGVNQ
jgi:Spy/CpxP family protein refolding chaperone